MNENPPSFLTVDEVCELHVDQIRLFGGTEGIRDRGGLESAVAQAQAAFGGNQWASHDLAPFVEACCQVATEPRVAALARRR